jgi:hypothetical protein
MNRVALYGNLVSGLLEQQELVFRRMDLHIVCRENDV